MCQVKYRVTLSPDERLELKGIVVSKKSSKLIRKRAYLLMALDDSVLPDSLSDEDAAKALGMSGSTAQAVRRLFVLEGFEAALRGKPRANPPTPPKIDGELEARLVQMACSKPPQGYGRWSLRLLTSRFVELAYPDGISHETIRSVLKKTSSSLGGRSTT
jgi:hypothetical protein